jgi:multidrug efflux pump subunit AcrA (membrane-fusion protein)
MKRLKTVMSYVLITAAVAFSVYTFVRVAAVPEAAEPPILSDTPARVYGVVEPAGREVYICPPVTRRVTGIWAREGEKVKKDQILCTLDNSVELQQLDLARAKVRAARKALELSMDAFERQQGLYKGSATAEVDYIRARLQAELDSANLMVAIEEVERTQAVLEQLDLTSPVDGTIYRFDVRLGETLVAGEGSRECPIVLGSEDLWVRLYVESFWAGRVSVGSTYSIYDSETEQPLGTGKVIYRAPYISRKSLRTEDVQERFDTGYQEVVLELAPDKAGIPIGLSVVANLEAGSKAGSELTN